MFEVDLRLFNGCVIYILRTIERVLCLNLLVDNNEMLPKDKLSQRNCPNSCFAQIYNHI